MYFFIQITPPRLLGCFGNTYVSVIVNKRLFFLFRIVQFISFATLLWIYNALAIFHVFFSSTTLTYCSIHFTFKIKNTAQTHTLQFSAFIVLPYILLLFTVVILVQSKYSLNNLLSSNESTTKSMSYYCSKFLAC